MPERAAIVYDCLYPVTMGGGERVYRRVAELLGQRGIRTDYITRLFDGPPIEDIAVVGVWRGEIYDHAGVRTTGGAVAFAWAVYRYFRRNRRSYDLVMASALPVLTVLAVRLALLGTPTRVIADWLEVWTAQTWVRYSGRVAGTLAFLLQAITVRVVREHTTDSAFTSRRLRELRPSLRPVTLGLMDLVSPGRPGPASSPPFVLFVGRLIPDKGAVAIPEAIAVARRAVPELRAVIIGEGPERSALEAAITAHGVSDAVDVLGRVSDETLDAQRARATVLVAPSIREGFGLAVAESMAWGVPAVVVAHEDNAAVDLVEVGVNGFVVAAGDPSALAAGIVEAIRGGDALRSSTSSWFTTARLELGLSASLDTILNSPRR